MAGQGGLRGVVASDPRPTPRSRAEGELATLLEASGVRRQAVYRPGEVCRLLRISRTTLLSLCALAEHPEARRTDPRGLASFLVGCHHRITHTALVDWLARNQRNQQEHLRRSGGSLGRLGGPKPGGRPQRQACI